MLEWFRLLLIYMNFSAGLLRIKTFIYLLREMLRNTQYHCF